MDTVATGFLNDYKGCKLEEMTRVIEEKRCENTKDNTTATQLQNSGDRFRFLSDEGAH